MSEKYISASKLKAHYSWLGKDATLSPKDVDDIIDAQPAADVEPVVRGEWFLLDDCANAGVYCSACKRAVFKESAWYKNVHIKSKYCPNCGAHTKRSDPRAETNQVDRCTTCDNNGKPICSNCIMTGHGNDIDFYRAATEPKGGLDGK